jgi:NAD(P)H dehydrogenase (quinone)
MGANPGSLFTAPRSHAETERDLQASGVRFTSLRNGFYATSAIWLLGPALHTGELDPARGRAGVLDCARRPRRSGRHRAHRRGPSRRDHPLLTGPQALDFAAIAATARATWIKAIRDYPRGNPGEHPFEQIG